MTTLRPLAASLLATLTLLAAGRAASAPGELDPTFNNGAGYAQLAAPANHGDPTAHAVCIDPQQRVVVAASVKSNIANVWLPQLLRTTSAGIPDSTLTAGLWLGVGASATLPQMPSLQCNSDRYVVASLVGFSSPYGVRLDQIPLAGGAGDSTTLGGGLVALQPRIALATPSYGSWWVGPGNNTPYASPTGMTSMLQYWFGWAIVTPQQDTARTAVGLGGEWAQLTDATVASNGNVYAIGRHLLNGNYQAYLNTFNSQGVAISSFSSGGYLGLQTADHDYGQRIALSADQQRLYAGLTTISPSNATVTAIRISRVRPNGSFDTAFASAGHWTLANAELGDVLEDAQGRVLVVGAHNGVAFIQRLLANGTPDSTFGPGGERQFGFGSLESRFNGVTLDANGRIVVTGVRNASSRGGVNSPQAVVIARVQP